jgi:hypothetical protein
MSSKNAGLVRAAGTFPGAMVVNTGKTIENAPFFRKIDFFRKKTHFFSVFRLTMLN